MPSWRQGVNAELNGDVILMAYERRSKEFGAGAVETGRLPISAAIRPTASAASRAIFVWNPTVKI
jgi:hypothetical protein